jgi:hypothetical protein
MATTRKLRLANGVQCVFEILKIHPEGLTTRELQQQLAEMEESAPDSAVLRDLSFDDLSFSCVGPIKAGWLTIDRDRWRLSETGRKAYEDYKDPSQFMSEAGKLSFQGRLAVTFPALYALAGNTKDQITSELRAMRRIGLSKLLSDTFGKVEDWETVLPLQSPQEFTLDSEPVLNTEALLQYLKSTGASYREGGHAIYLPPQAFRAGIFAGVAANYPADAGMKIVKNEGGVDQSGYLAGAFKGDSRIQAGLVHSHRHLSLVANLFYLKDVGPRLYDLINLKSGETVWAAYIVQDIGDRVPSNEECERGLEKLRDMDQSRLIRVILPEGFKDEEFECPDCGRNAFIDEAGNFRYIDFQNFRLVEYGSFLTDLAANAAEQTHFGDTLLLRGKRYLYQSVPGVKLPAKRDINNRIKTLTKLLAEANVSVARKLVLDVGCNIGMMMAQYLKLGAGWCHGWDRSVVIPNTERMLLALGCTRFSTTGTDLTSDRSLLSDLPDHVKNSVEGCAISYLAVRGHLNWLDDLARIPWSFMIYEGHEGEMFDEFREHVADLQRLKKVKAGPVATYTDGDSEERIVALILSDN